ncbi:MAG: restriction endonuclease subunit S [Methanosarcina mazei]|mgnify:CR=1 FL=1|uniref:restriction endonuclease subunit S n=1 Tax=Methanosarcina soligelidi TaxID=1036677 RepID=UPI00064E6CBA|nr:restriction endonuclease subunit S [Methanosarcina soligelidi]
MNKNWEMKKLGEVCTLQRGFDLPKNSRTAGNFPLVSSSGIIDTHEIWKVKAPGVVTGRSGSIGNVFYIEDDFWPLNTVLYIKDFHKNDVRFVYYLLTQIDLKKYSSGTGVPTLNRNNVHEEIISIPKSLTEQQRIVDILDETFAAIDKVKENAEKNLQNSRELFESYLQSVYTNPRDDWDKKTLNEISENLDNKRVPITKNKRKSGIYPYYGASGIVDYVDEYIFDEELLLVSEDGANLLARSTPIAFSVSGKIWVNNHAHILRFKNMVTQKFVEMFFASIKLDEYITGTAQPKLNQSALNSIIIPYPPLAEQQSIVAKLDALSSETKRLEEIYQQKLAALDELKKSVLQKAFNGELTGA